MRKIIKIFLASSIVEFANERMVIENFIRNISDKYEENYDIKIQPLLCENLDDAVAKVRKQEEFNEKIRESEICFFLFFTKVGEYTREEFETARKKFLETGRPKIYTYFKVIKDEKVEDSLNDFKKELDKVVGHFYGMFDHIDTLKLRILQSLSFLEKDFTEIKVQNGKYFMDGKSVMSLNNVSEFANNSRLKRLEEELKQAEDYLNNFEGSDKTDEIEKMRWRKNYLKDSINTLQEKIFKISLEMSNDLASFKVSERQKQAYRLFEEGNIYEAITKLPSNEIMDDYKKAEQLYLTAIIDAAKRCIKEQRLAIGLLQQNEEVSPAVEHRIVERYKLIVPIIKKHMIEIDAMYDYMMFMDNSTVVNDKDELLHVAKDLFEIYLEQASFRTLYSMYDTCNIIAENLPDNDPDIQYYTSMALCSLDEYLQNVVDKNSLTYAFDCMRVAELPLIDDAKAISLYKEAISVFEKHKKSQKASEYISLCRKYIDRILG